MTPNRPVVYLIDDDQGVCDALSALIRSAGLECRTFLDSKSFLAEYDPHRLSCLVLDVVMPGMDGLELQAELTEHAYPPPIIFITGFGDVEMAVRVMKRGAADFLEKPFRNEDLIARINRVLEAEAPRHNEHVLAGEARGRLARLTPRERQVLDLIVAGLSNKQIARKLDIGSRTVEIHRAHVMSKMDVRSVVALVRMTLLAGLPPEPASD